MSFLGLGRRADQHRPTGRGVYVAFDAAAAHAATVFEEVDRGARSRQARASGGRGPYSPAKLAVRDHMSSDLLSVEADVSIMEVARRMVDRDVGAVLVLDDGRLNGILTERDLLRAIGRGLREDTRVADCMTAHPETIGPDDTTEHAVVLMLHGGFRHLPVVQGDDLVGVISMRDLAPLVLEDRVPRGV